MPDALFWIASMTKPVTGTVVLMIQDEGRLNVAHPVAKYPRGVRLTVLRQAANGSA